MTARKEESTDDIVEIKEVTGLIKMYLTWILDCMDDVLVVVCCMFLILDIKHLQ